MNLGSGLSRMSNDSATGETFSGFVSAPIVFTLTTLFLISLHYFVLEPLFFGQLSHIAGPKLAALSWYYLSFFDLRLCRNETITKWHEKYGPVVRIRPNEVTVAAPEDFREVYDAKTKYDKSQYFKRFRLYGEDNLFSTTGYADHQVKKRRLAGIYTKTTVVQNAEPFVRERVQTLLRQVTTAPNGIVNFFLTWDCFTLDVITRYLYGAPHGALSLETPKDRSLVVNLKRSQIWMPISINFGWLHGSWLLKRFLPEDYTRTLNTQTAVKDFLLRLMEEQDEDPKQDMYPSVYRTLREARAHGEPLSRSYMASELFDHLKAGQQTTASTLTFLTWRLSRHPEWQRKLQAEIRALSAEDDIPSYKDLEKCSVLDAVVKETLRVHPAASGRGERVVPSGGKVYSGVFVPAGTTVIGPILAVHSNQAAFPDPLSWRPERWLKADSWTSKEMERSYVPFGYGARICIGMHLAMLEMKVAVAGLYRRVSTSLGETCTDEEMYQLGTLTAVPRGLRCALVVTEDR